MSGKARGENPAKSQGGGGRPVAPKAAPEGAPATLPPGAQRFMLAQPATLSERIIGRMASRPAEWVGSRATPRPQSCRPRRGLSCTRRMQPATLPTPTTAPAAASPRSPAAPGDQQEGRRGPRVGQCGALTTPPGSQQGVPSALHSHLSQVGHRCGHTHAQFIQEAGQEGTPICSGQSCPVRHRTRVSTASELSMCRMNE